MYAIKLLLTFLLALALPALAISPSTQDEINHLLAYVKNTQCQYERNGSQHTGEEAVKHIQKKYDYFSDDITTAEEFIKYSATKSTFSGKHYQVHCSGQPTINSKDWLLKELTHYRHTQNQL